MRSRHIYGSSVAFFVFVVACGSSSSSGPAAGTEGGPCYGNMTCNPGLTCGSNLCVNLGTDGSVIDSASDVAQSIDANVVVTTDASDSSAVDSGADAGGFPAKACTTGTAPLLVYMNRAGGTYTTGTTDSTTNKSDRLSAATAVIPASTITEQDWLAVEACIGQKFLPFNVTFTDIDPATTTHIEVTLAPSNIAALDFNGGPFLADIECNGTPVKLPNAVGFINTDIATAPNMICALGAQIIGVSEGLDNTTTCPDAMTTSDATCLTAGFSNSVIACDATQLGKATGCACSAGTTQNSYQAMAAAAGLCN